MQKLKSAKSKLQSPKFHLIRSGPCTWTNIFYVFEGLGDLDRLRVEEDEDGLKGC